MNCENKTSYMYNFMRTKTMQLNMLLCIRTALLSSGVLRPERWLKLKLFHHLLVTRIMLANMASPSIRVSTSAWLCYIQRCRWIWSKFLEMSWNFLTVNIILLYKMNWTKFPKDWHLCISVKYSPLTWCVICLFSTGSFPIGDTRCGWARR